MSHTYKEIRDIALDLLFGREPATFGLAQYPNLQDSIAEVFVRRSTPPTAERSRHDRASLSVVERNLFREVFWDLFRQGIITPGVDDSNREFPFFCLSSFGRKFLEDHNSLFFHDVSSYMERIVTEIPNIDDTTKPYLEEAIRAFMATCYLSSTVMLGVAIEHTFDLLLETIAKNPKYAPTFAKVSQLRHYGEKVNKFKSLLVTHMGTLGLDDDIKEGLETQFSGIVELIRLFRNDSGHPTGKLISHDQAFVLLQLFIPCCKKLYQLRGFFTAPTP
jgi:hypothetical protein